MLTHSDYRYSKVQTILESFNATKVCDLGCGQGKFLRRLTRTPEISKIIGIDYEKSDLMEAKFNLLPEAFDYILKEGKRNYYKDRKNGLEIKLYHADILRRFDEILLNEERIEYFTMIEVIEHLYLDQLPALKENLFGIIRPKVVIMTTPNKEYNVNYDAKNLERLRHPDHKFEFTQEEFNSWCEEAASEFGYNYEMEGVGKYHAESPESRGFCSQICIFTLAETPEANEKANDKIESLKIIESQKIELIDTIEYPSSNAL